MIHISLIKSIDDHLKEKAQKCGTQTAYCDSKTSVTYEELEQRTARLATAFQETGINLGEAVGVFLPSSVHWIESCLAIVRRGAVAVAINYDASEDEVLYMLQDSACSAVISTPERAELLNKVGTSVPSMKVIVLVGSAPSASAPNVKSYESLLTGSVRQDASQGNDIDAPSFILYTSGTTGKPKGVELTQRNMLWVIAAAWKPIAGMGYDDYLLSPLPLFHSYAVNLVVLAPLVTGAKARILERFSTNDILSLLSSGEFTIFSGVPTMFNYLLQRANDGPLNFGKLRLCISAGAVMPATLNEEFERRTKVCLIDGLGATETATMITLNWPGSERVMGSCGAPILGQAVRIVDPITRRDVTPGNEGELIVRGANVMLGYHNRPEETAKALVDGWYLTGDLARCDPNGLITITGRIKELIIRGGENIAPAEIEEVVMQIPGIEDCSAVAGPDQNLGEIPVLFVVPKPGFQLDSATIKGICANHLSSYKVPAAIHFIDRIPRTGSGKALRHQLRKRLDVSS